MTKIDMLEKVIKYAEKNGYKSNYKFYCGNLKSYIKEIKSSNIYYALLFDHNFAKAFFLSWLYQGNPDDWKWYLQQAIISDDPLRYYYDFVKEK